MEREVRRRQAEALDRYWDAVVAGEEQGASPDVGGAPDELIRQLQSLGSTPGMEKARGRIWEHVTHRPRRDLEEMAADATGILPGILPAMGMNGRVDLLPVPEGSPRPHVAPEGRWMMTQFATAALVVVTLTFAYLAFGPPRSGRQDEPAAWIPAAFSTPASSPASPAASQAAEAPLVEITLPAVGMPATIFGALTHFTIPPGSSGRYEPTRFSDTCCTGVRLSYVLEGTYAVRGDGPMQVMRNGTDTWKEMWVGTEIVVTPGDALLSRMEDSFDATNAGATPVELLDGELFEGDVSTDPIPQDRAGASAWRSHDQDILFTPQAVPPGLVILRLQQATLPNGGVLPPPPGVILHWAVSLDVDDVVITEKPDNPDAFSLRNLGVGPATVYVLSLQSAGTEAEAGNPLAAGTPEP
jgi:hypothetical protein